MGDLSDKVCTLYDYGYNLGLARRLACEFGLVNYFVPWKDTSPESVKLSIGTGYGDIVRVRHFADVINSTDLFVFPDIYDGDTQHDLIMRGKRVWGARKGDRLEYDRAHFIKLVEKLGLPVPDYEICEGIDELEAYLKKNENQWIKVNLRGDCFDSETEIFTESGWVPFPQVTTSHKVLTMDLGTRQVHFAQPSAIIQMPHSGPMYRIESKMVDALVTPNHHLWVKTPNVSRWRYLPIHAMTGDFTVPQSFKWLGLSPELYEIPNTHKNYRHISRKSAQSKTLPMSQWLKFLGWFAGEGSVTNRNRVCISQSPTANPDKYAEIRTTCLALGYNPQKDGNSFSIYDKSLCDHLKLTCYTGEACGTCGRHHCAHTKQVPRFVKELSPDLISNFLSTYAKADGCRDKRSGQIRYYTSSKNLANDVQELIFKSGDVGSVSVCSKVGDVGGVNQDGKRIVSRTEGFCIGHCRMDDSMITKESVSLVNYTGIVYDVTVNPHHTIFVRRNGKAFWSGNSETWQHTTWDRTVRKIEALRHRYGPIGNDIIFTVVAHIDSTCEAAYDGFCVTSQEGKAQFPETGFLGYEKKNKCHILRAIPYDDFPDAVREVNDVFAPMLAKYWVRGGFGTEIKIVGEGKSQKNYFLDATVGRQPSPPGEIIMEMVTNLGEFFYEGAEGNMIPLEIEEHYGVQVSLYSDVSKSNFCPVVYPEEIDPWVKLCRACYRDDMNQIVPDKCVTVGSEGVERIGDVVAIAEDIETAIDLVKERCGMIEGDVDCEVDALADLLKVLKEGEEMGIDMGEVPEPASVLED